ncbi:hypothetical protein HY491_03870 [Candidatus Woesearchaeota archaeon]|nr:hypothetical protein [Candidatus Woesearchaeota archaeon]
MHRVLTVLALLACIITACSRSDTASHPSADVQKYEDRLKEADRLRILIASINLEAARLELLAATIDRLKIPPTSASSMSPQALVQAFREQQEKREELVDLVVEYNRGVEKYHNDVAKLDWVRIDSLVYPPEETPRHLATLSIE